MKIYTKTEIIRNYEAGLYPTLELKEEGIYPKLKLKEGIYPKQE